MALAVRTASTPWLTLQASRHGFVLRFAAGRATTRVELTHKQAQILIDRLTDALRRSPRPGPVLVEDPDSWRDPEIL